VHPKLATIEHRRDAANPIAIAGFSWMTREEAVNRGWLDAADAERLH